MDMAQMDPRFPLLIPNRIGRPRFSKPLSTRSSACLQTSHADQLMLILYGAQPASLAARLRKRRGRSWLSERRRRRPKAKK